MNVSILLQLAEMSAKDPGVLFVCAIVIFLAGLLAGLILSDRRADARQPHATPMRTANSSLIDHQVAQIQTRRIAPWPATQPDTTASAPHQDKAHRRVVQLKPSYDSRAKRT